MDKGQINPDKNITNFDDVSCIAFLKFDMNCNYWLTCIQEPYPDMAVRVFQDAQKSKFHGDVSQSWLLYLTKSLRNGFVIFLAKIVESPFFEVTKNGTLSAQI